MLVTHEASAPANRNHHLLRGLMLLALVGMCVLRSSIGTRIDSFTVDEPWHIVAGTTYARTGEFSLNPEHPPLVKLFVGAAMPESFRLRPTKILSEKAQERTWVEETMFVDNDPLRAQATSRVAMWTLNGLLLLTLGLLLWRAAGWVWAFGTLGFLVLEPTVGAHLPVVMTDLPLALTLSIAVVAAGLLAARWQWRWVVGCGLAIGITLGAKHSALAGLCGLGAVLLCACALGWRNGRWRAVLHRLGQLAVVAVLAIAVLWATIRISFPCSGGRQR